MQINEHPGTTARNRLWSNTCYILPKYVLEVCLFNFDQHFNNRCEGGFSDKTWEYIMNTWVVTGGQ